MTSLPGEGGRAAGRLVLVLLLLVVVLVVDLVALPPDDVAQAAYLVPVLVAGLVTRGWALWAVAGAAALAHGAALVVGDAASPVLRGVVLAAVAGLLVAALERRAPRRSPPGVPAVGAQVPATRRAGEDVAQRELVRATDVADLARLAPLAHPADEPLGTGMLLAHLDLLGELTEVHGPEAGETAVAHVAAVLRAAVRPGDTVARLGQSALVVLMPGVGEEAVRPRGEALRRVVRDSPLPWEGVELQVSISVGAAHTAAGHPDLSALHAAAEDALRQAQAEGRGSVGWP